MLPDGMRNASIRKVRRRSQTTTATQMDLVHSHMTWPVDGAGTVVSVMIRSVRGQLTAPGLGRVELSIRHGPGHAPVNAAR